MPTGLGRSSSRRRRTCFMSEAFHRATLCCTSWWTGAQHNSHFSNWSPAVCLAGVERKRGIQGFFRRNCKKNSRALFDVSQLRFYLCACVQVFFFFLLPNEGESEFFRLPLHRTLLWEDFNVHQSEMKLSRLWGRKNITGGVSPYFQVPVRPPRKLDVICLTLDPASRQSIP